ncbi:hypothetical protein BH23GEM9_BH23GEM9_21110 [soil metagenome]
MRVVGSGAALLLLGLAAGCANAQPGADPASGAGQVVTQPVIPLECRPSERMPLAGRASPYDSVDIVVGSERLRICYGRPYAQGREIFGGLVPWDRLWRTGANEPTIMHLPFTASVAGITVPPGSYSIYTEPGQTEWTLIINRSTSQWGHESSYTDAIRGQELGRASVATERLDQFVEQFTIRGEPISPGGHVLLEWERTRARIPVTVLEPSG